MTKDHRCPEEVKEDSIASIIAKYGRDEQGIPANIKEDLPPMDVFIDSDDIRENSA